MIRVPDWRKAIIMTEHALTAQQRKNREAYNAERSKLEREHHGRVALLHDGEIIRIFNDRWDAYTIGVERFGEGHFSVKTIGEPPVSLGAAAGYTRPVPFD